MDRTKVKDLEMRHCPGRSRWTQDNHSSPQKLRPSWLRTQPPIAGFADVERGCQPWNQWPLAGDTGKVVDSPLEAPRGVHLI